MAGSISTAIIATVLAALLAACSKEPPKCSDDDTFAIVRKIIIDQVGGSEGLSENEIQENMKIEFPRASSFDEKIKKYSCEAKLVAGGIYQLPITYESQLDDKNEHIVSVGGISRGDLFAVQSGLIEGIKKSRAAKDEATPQPQEAPATSSAKPLPVDSPQSPKEETTVEQSGICKGLDPVITAEQLECFDRKFVLADKQLNEGYKQLMSTLDDSRKTALKKEQVAWIKEKEAKCAQAGKEVEGGSMEAVLISDCKVQMTEQRLAYLISYK